MNNKIKYLGVTLLSLLIVTVSCKKDDNNDDTNKVEIQKVSLSKKNNENVDQ